MDEETPGFINFKSQRYFCNFNPVPPALIKRTRSLRRTDYCLTQPIRASLQYSTIFFSMSRKNSRILPVDSPAQAGCP